MSNLLNDLVAEFTQLPGIGTKTAQRLAFHILKTDAEKVNRLANAIVRAKRDLKTCQICGYFSEEDTCPICQDDRRDKSIVCVVQESSDVITLERIQEYKGRYHVLNGVISPIDGIGPDDINIAGLLNRIRDGEVREVIVATNPNVSVKPQHFIFQNF